MFKNKIFWGVVILLMVILCFYCCVIRDKTAEVQNHDQVISTSNKEVIVDEGDIKIVMEKHPNPYARGFHTSKRVLPMDESIILFESTRFEKHPLIVPLLEIEGVKGGAMKPYEVSVYITHAKSWEDILPEVEKELTNYFKK